MKSEHKALLDQAIGALQLRDVMLNECTFKRPHPPPTDADEIEVKQLTRREVSFVLGEGPGGPENAAKLLQVIVSLGLRVAGMEAENPPIYFEIEADFLVEYDVRDVPSRESIKLFADLNSVHNVWPFWRQHVFDIVGRARLPHLNVPLFSGMKPDPETSSRPPSREDAGEVQSGRASRPKKGKTGASAHKR